MEKTVFITFAEYASLVNKLKEETGLDLFMAASNEESFKLIECLSSGCEHLVNSTRKLRVLIGQGRILRFQKSQK